MEVTVDIVLYVVARDTSVQTEDIDTSEWRGKLVGDWDAPGIDVDNKYYRQSPHGSED